MLANVIVAIIWVGVVAYAVFGGADFGSGFWDFLAGSPEKGAPTRRRIDKSIGPVWEANHVWLIFVIVFLWTAFPTAFAALMTATFVPLIGAAVGIILRGAAFALRKSSGSLAQARFFGITFALSSVVTPFFFGAIAGAVASGRVPLDGQTDAWGVWLTPTSLLGGVLAVGVCAWLAAVFLAADSSRDGEPELAAAFTNRALATGVVVGLISLVGIYVLETDAVTLADGLERAGAPLVALSAAGGLTAMWFLRAGKPGQARVPAAISVVTIVVGWGVGQYPWVLVDVIEIEDAVGARSTLWGLLIAFIGAAVLVIPPLVWMLRLSGVGSLSVGDALPDSSYARLTALQADQSSVSDVDPKAERKA